jgi:hypothetical protein
MKRTAEDLLRHYSAAVDDLEACEYIHEDEADLDNDIAIRFEIEDAWQEFTPEQRRRVESLDARFRAALWPALRQARLERWYRNAEPLFPESSWWWHVPEPPKTE